MAEDLAREMEEELLVELDLLRLELLDHLDRPDIHLCRHCLMNHLRNILD